MKLGPHQIDPDDADGNTVPDGTYGFGVSDGKIAGLALAVGLPTGGAAGETLAKVSGTDYDAEFVDSSVPVILLPAGSDAGDVPAGTPVGAVIAIKA